MRNFRALLFLLSAGIGTLPAGTIKGYPMPSVEDEKNTYTAWGWTWSPSAEPAAVQEPILNFSVSNPDIHGDSEGDDLWTYLMMYLRSGNTVYLNRATAWAQYFKSGYRISSLGLRNDYGYDWCHVYGWGLLAWAEYRDDAAALAAAESIPAFSWSGQTLEAEKTRGTPGQAQYGSDMRGAARHLLCAVRLAEATQKPRWIAWRDKLLDCWLQAPDWDPRGMYFNPAKTAEALGSSAWASGARCQNPFMIGILTEAFAQAYRTTGRAEIKTKMIEMAKFIDRYGVDSTCQLTGSIFGIVNGRNWHNYFTNGCGGFADPVYTTSLVNTLVWGYIFTGDRHYLDRAMHFFNRGTKGVYGSATTRTAPDNVAHHFVDTRFDAGGFFLGYNKGELQYTYLLFSNPDSILAVERGRAKESAVFSIQVSPNPFSASAAIQVSAGRAPTGVTATVYEVSGKVVEALPVSGGRNAFVWDASGKSGGIYILKVTAGKEALIRRLYLKK